jgi:D-serine deaminase-like pyridoxal phosphate-dependent protein
MIDIDSGLGRTGVSFSDALSFGRKVAAVPGLALKGVQCYAGHLQHVKSYEERKKASLDGLLKAAETVRVLREEFPDCAVFTGTGTGTHDIDSAVPELTDMQTGSYVFMDAEYMETGSAANPDGFLTFKPSLRLLTTVVSSNQPQWVTVDAGLKAMYYTENVRPVIFGHEKEGWLYRWYGDEHGKIIVPSPEQKPALGEVLELCVSHCDPTVNLHDKLYIVKDDLVIDQWKIDSRGRCE